MVEIVWLKPDEQPPEGTGWVLVARDTSRPYSGTDSESRGEGTIFHVPFPATEAKQAVVIEQAKQWATKRGISTVYVVMQ